jgi:PsbP
MVALKLDPGRRTVASGMKVTLVTFLLAVTLVASAGCGGGGGGGGEGGGGDGDKTFEGDGFSFAYPGGWSETGEFESKAQAGSESPGSQVAVAPGEEGQDLVLVQVGPTSPSITEDNIDELEGEIARQVESLFQQAEGQVTDGPTRVTAGGLPALGFEATSITSDGVSVESRLTLIYDGRNQYAVNCQFTPEGATEIERGCDQILSSFQVELVGESGGSIFEGDGYSFVHPEEWIEVEQGESSVEAGEQISPSVYFAPRGGSVSDILSVDVYRTRVAVTEENIAELTDQFAAEIDALVRQAQGRITRGPARVTIDGLPGLRFEASALDPEGVRIQSLLAFVFDGRTEYALNCQFTPEAAEEMKRGCDQAVESFEVE